MIYKRTTNTSVKLSQPSKSGRAFQSVVQIYWFPTAT
jgi:hypothetical protein